ncbi:MAG: RsmB/NOP family class I SAM-dependent RNA methyltransferase, partial [Candidatus Thermoplasmatota archaeon]|nr:RsmB/NOP family class I SAM-dependent RNA methyltransferase [Candidatus Thermoplasmatota archaeon]
MEMRRDFARDVFSVLADVFQEGKTASSAMSRALEANPDWSDRKRALFSNTIYDIIRYWRFLWTAIDREPSFDDRDLWHLMGAYQIKRGEELDNIREYRGLTAQRVKNRMEKARSVRVIRESIPDWLDRLGEEELGDDWDPVMHSLNTYPPLVIRVNNLRTDADALKARLKEAGHDTRKTEIAPDALVFKQKMNVFRLPEFREGLFEVQDPASQLVSIFLGVEPGMKVVDACAGQGGKTLHLSCLMEGRGRLLAMDDVEWKLSELRKRAKRAGARNVETRAVTGTKSYKRMKGTFDRLLMDVPCSGTGAMRRNPDLKWSLTPETLERLKKLQRDILISYTPLVKEGGRFVYSTCSVLPSEGEEQIRWFLGER